MNDAVKIYCDGAAMAYKDCSDTIVKMVEGCPPELKTIMDGLIPLADAMRAKATEVYKEADSFLNAMRQ